MGRIYTADFSEVSVVAQQDLFQIEALTVPAVIHGVILGQTSEVGDANAEHLSILFRRFTDIVTNDIVEAKLDLTDAAAFADLAINETTELITGTEVVHADVWNIALPFIWLPPPDMRIIVQIGDGLAINLNTTPADAIIMSGTLYFSEQGS